MGTLKQRAESRLIMCMSSSPSVMSNTTIYAGEATHNDEQVHVLAYQNNAASLTNKPNAMILPFPAAKQMGQENVIDTRPFKSFLKDITNASRHRSFRRNFSEDFDGVELF